MISVSKLIPEKLIDQELYSKVIEILDFVMAEYEDDFNDILNKYRDYANQNPEGVRTTIGEMGFGDVLDVLELSDSQVATFGYFVGLIGLLKGTSEGVVLVSRLLGGDAQLTDWWQATPNLVPYTYDMIWTIPYGVITPELFERFKVFLRSYIYPVLNTWIIATTCAFGFDGDSSLIYGYSDIDLDKYWVASTAITLNEYYTPTVPNSMIYKCTVAGTTSTVEPTWVAVAGETIIDGTVTWECVAPTATPGGQFAYIHTT